MESSPAEVHSPQPDLSSPERRLRLFAGSMCSDVPNRPHLLPSEQLLLLPSFLALLQLDHSTLPSPSLPLRIKMEPPGQKVRDTQPNLRILASLQLHPGRMHQRMPSKHSLHQGQQCLQLHCPAANLQLHHKNLCGSRVLPQHKMEHIFTEMFTLEWQLCSLAII